MARKPTYPDDAPVGDPVGAADSGSDAVKPEEDRGQGSTRTRQLVTGAAIGIGSAALVAALLYANRAKGSRKSEGEKE